MRRRRPRIVKTDAVTSARASVRQKIEEELAWAEAYVEEVRLLQRFITQAESQERNEGKPHPRPNAHQRMEDTTS